MAITSQERSGKALELLKAGLGPLSSARCKKNRGQNEKLLVLWPSPAQSRQTRPKIFRRIEHSDFASRHFFQ